MISPRICHSRYNGLRSRYGDWLWAERSGDRIPVGSRFHAPVQTCPGAHPASCTRGTASFPVVKRPGRRVDHPPPSSAEVKEGVEIYYSPLWAFVACCRVNFTTRFNTHEFYDLPTQCIYVLFVDLRTNSDYFPTQRELMDRRREETGKDIERYYIYIITG